MTDVEAIDIWCNPFLSEAMEQFYGSNIQEAAELFGRPDLFRDAVRTSEEFVALLDEVGVELAMVPALKYGNAKHRGMEIDVPYELIHELCKEYPDRFRGMAGINPHDGMEGVRQLERAVEDYGFVGAHIDVYGFDVPLNDRRFYPFYAKCVELDVPVVAQTGHSAIPSPNKHGKPLLFDDVAIDFPELDIVGAHTGWPWTEELVALAWVHPNVYIGTTGYAPSYWDESLVHFLQAHGRGKVLWGTNYPVVKHDQSLSGVDDFELSPDVEREFLRETAIDVFDLDL